jgi:hypothetical protein
MRTALAALALVFSPAVLAEAAQPVQAVSASLASSVAAPGHRERIYQRYCEKLREGPEAYAAFVKRMATVTGYTFTDFAPRDANDTVRHQCRDAAGTLASREQRGG